MPNLITINAQGKAYTVDRDKMNEATMLALATQGLRIVAQRVNASNADYKPEEKQAEVAKALEAIEGNAYSFGGGGTGQVRDPHAKEVKRLMLVSLAALKVKSAEARKYSLAQWADEFAEDAEAAIEAINTQAAINVAGDADFLATVKPPKIARLKTEDEIKAEGITVKVVTPKK